MKRFILFLLAAGLVFTMGAQGAAAQTATTATFTGKAIRWDGTPVSGATIAALRGPLETDQEVIHTTTAADGSYSLTVPATGTYWLHIRTLGSWWGYSYTPITPQPGETISQIYFALGPRDVKDPIVLPAPISDREPPTAQPTSPPAAPAVPATATPVSNVKPIVGVNDDPAPPARPVTPAHPGTLPHTGANDGFALGTWSLLALLGLVLVGFGTSLRVLRRR
jgi:hypothetical protein